MDLIFITKEKLADLLKELVKREFEVVTYSIYISSSISNGYLIELSNEEEEDSISIPLQHINDSILSSMKKKYQLRRN